MAYTITRTDDCGTLLGGNRVKVCRVDSLATARLWFEDWCAADPADPELLFEIDPDGNDAADVAVIGKMAITLYTVERDQVAA